MIYVAAHTQLGVYIMVDLRVSLTIDKIICDINYYKHLSFYGSWSNGMLFLAGYSAKKSEITSKLYSWVERELLFITNVKIIGL